MARILIIDSDNESRLQLFRLCESLKIYVTAVATPTEAHRMLKGRLPDLVIACVRPFDNELITLLEGYEFTGNCKLLLTCDTPTVALARIGMRLSAVELLAKPVASDTLTTLLGELILDDQHAVDVEQIGDLVCASPAMHRVLDTLSMAYQTRANILLVGETGVGKEALCRQLTKEHQVLHKINCAALSRQKVSLTAPIDSEKPVCWYFDNLLSLDHSGQSQLADFFATSIDGNDHLKVMSAADGDILAAVNEGKFRQDLYYQLAQVTVFVPPLRERPDDVLALLDSMLQALNTEHGQNKQFDEASIDLLLKHDWPGNIRELENTVFHAYILGDETMTVECLPQSILIPNQVIEAGASVTIEIGQSLAEIEKMVILATMNQYDQDKKLSADVLGISLRTLYNKLDQYAERSRG